MAIVECRNLKRDYAGTPVLDGIDLRINEGDKVGLVGANGAGKTTLLNALAGLDDDFRGARVVRPGARIGFLTQHVEPPGELRAIDYMLVDCMAATARLRDVEERLAAADGGSLDRLMKEYERAFEEHEALGGDFTEERASRALALVGLGERENTPAASLLGGERGTLALARALQGNPDLLILDEPGNHLDFWGMAWLEEFLAGLKSAVLLVSHNRMLLDRAVGRVVELERGRAKEYTGDYSAYRLEKLRNAATRGEDWQASRKKIERLEKMVERCATRAAAFTKRQAKSSGALGQVLRARRRQLEREKDRAVAKPDLGSTAITASFSGRGAAEVKSDFALIVEGYTRGYGDTVLYDNASFDVLTGERVALVGPNGCGKTTFLRDLVERADWENGPIRVCPSMKVGYVAQDRDGFRRGRTVRGEFEALGARESDLRAILRDYGFGRDDPDRLIETLSGGELNRLQLARAVWTGSNFLVLDEPTNHLDIDARESVEDCLAEYDGTVFIVSHDRYFIEKVADRIVYVTDRKFVPFEGTFTEFWAESGAGAARVAGPGHGGVAVGERGVLARCGSIARAKAASGKNARETLAVEERIVELESVKTGLERRVRDAFERREFALARKLSNELQDTLVDIERLYAKWGA